MTADVLVQPTQRGEITLLEVCGLIDTYSANSFAFQVRMGLPGRTKKVVLNCQSVNYMSSLGIGAVINLHKEIAQRGGQMLITGLKSRIYEVFQGLGLTSVLSFADEDETAIALLKEEKTYFPATISCVICRRKLSAPRSGSFRCPACKTVLAVGPTAQVHLR